jgi:methionyl-tRNA formyltransferase
MDDGLQMTDDQKDVGESLSSAVRHPLSVVFMGTPAFALPALKALAQSKHKLVAVYTQPPRPAGRGQKETPSPVHQFAIERGIPVYTPASLKGEEAQAEFAALKADIAVVVAYGLLLPQPILEAFPLGCVNIHPSALPRWRGAAPLQRTIMAGDKTTKIIIMQMDAGLDTGDILLAEDFEITDGMNAGELHDALAEKSAPLLLKVLDEIYDINHEKQSEIGILYAKKITKDDQKIDWQKPAHEIRQQILGLSPSQGAFFSHNNEIIKIFNAIIEDGKAATKEAGTVIDEKLGIVCGDGKILRPLTLQRPNKKRMELNEFLNGFSIIYGGKLK